MLRVTLAINAETIADYEVRNVGDVGPGECRYEIRPIVGAGTGDVIATVNHYHAQGALSLAEKACSAVQRSLRRENR